MPRSSWRWLQAGAAVLLLDITVTFTNWWPTPAIWWNGAPSLELAVLTLALATFASREHETAAEPERKTASSRRLVGWLGALWTALAIGRYVDVTAPALWGRELNFFWDLRFLPDVAALLLGASRRAILLGSIATLIVVSVLAVLFVSMRWAMRTLIAAAGDSGSRRVLAAVAALVVMLYAAQMTGLFGRDYLGEERRVFPKPVTQVYARQVRLVTQALTRKVKLPPSPALDADLAAVQGADVFLFFVESYGAVTYDNPRFAARLVQPREHFARAIQETGREVVSAFVRSPTFGGSSWFAHISFLSGLKVDDPDVNALLMTEKRPTVVTNFAARGYRTLAMMPGLWYPWPEGSFYGFQDIYDGPRLAYQGPSFGWWDMPDQFTLAKLDAVETSKAARQPLFVFYPTVSTHTPFTPLPPYVADWSKMLTDRPYTDAELDKAYVGEPTYMDLSPNYIDSVAYAYETFAGYVRQRAGRDYVMILIGDHQPPALVAGEGARWDVPVHIITNRREIVDALLRSRFTRGLMPPPAPIGEMHEIVPSLLSAFSNSSPAPPHIVN